MHRAVDLGTCKPATHSRAFAFIRGQKCESTPHPGLNPKTETRRKDALCSEWRQNGKDGKVASTHDRVQTAGRRTNEDLQKHTCFSARAEDPAEAALHLEVPVGRPPRTAACEAGENR